VAESAATDSFLLVADSRSIGCNLPVSDAGSRWYPAEGLENSLFGQRRTSSQSRKNNVGKRLKIGRSRRQIRCLTFTRRLHGGRYDRTGRSPWSWSASIDSALSADRTGVDWAPRRSIGSAAS